MHIPDGFLDAKTAAATALLSVAGVGLAIRHVRRELPPRRVPLLGLSAAFLFTAQMVNFPVVGGTSGHLIGGVLVAALLGPSAAVVVVAAVLIVQCFLFQDGGVMALGANVLNMALLGAVGGYFLYRAVAAVLPGPRGRVTALAFAGWCSTLIAAVACAGELASSGTVPWRAVFPAMAGIHMVIGVGEGLIGALVFVAVRRIRPELVEPADTRRGGELVPLGLIAAIGIGVFVAPFASSRPDGLESVARSLGFAHRAPERAGAGDATAIAAAVGAILVFALALALGRVLVPRRVDGAVGRAQGP